MSIGREIVERDAPVVEVVLPPPHSELATPRGMAVTRSANATPHDGPYRAGSLDQRVTIQLGAGSLWLAALALLVIAVAAHEVAGMIGVTVAGIVVAGLVVVTRPAIRTRIMIDRETLQVPDARPPISIPTRAVVAVETYERRTRMDATIAGVSVHRNIGRVASYHVRARTGDGESIEIASLPTLDACWWLELTIEQALSALDVGR